MSVIIHISTQLTPLAGGQAKFEVEGHDVRAAIEALETRFPRLRARLRDVRGDVRRFVKILLDTQDIRYLDYLDTRLHHGAELRIDARDPKAA